MNPKDWVRIGPPGRRSVWLRLHFPDPTQLLFSPKTVPYFELRGGREGDDAYLKIDSSNPQYAELLEMMLVAQFAALS
jgi:hypothetical protein